MSKPLREELAEFQSTLDLVRKQYEEDGTITADEQSRLDLLESKIKRLFSTARGSEAGNGNGLALSEFRSSTQNATGIGASSAGGFISGKIEPQIHTAPLAEGTLTLPKDETESSGPIPGMETDRNLAMPVDTTSKPPRPESVIQNQIKIAEESLEGLKRRALPILSAEGISAPPAKPTKHGQPPSPNIDDVKKALKRIANDDLGAGSPRRQQARDLIDQINNVQNELTELNKERKRARAAYGHPDAPTAPPKAPPPDPKKGPTTATSPGNSTPKSPPATGGANAPKPAVNRFAKVSGKVAQLQKLGGIFAASYKGYFSRGFQGMLSLGGTILEGFQTLSDAYTVLAGGAYIFTQQVAQANDLGAHTMALVNGYRDAGYHKSLDDMFKLAREIDQEDPDGLYGADALSTFSAGIEIDVIKHRDQCQDLLTVMQEVYRRAFTGEQLSKKLLSDHTFLVAASYVNAEQDLWKAYQDFGKIMGALNVEYLEGHLKIVNEDLKRIQDSIINDLTFGYLDEG
jgi:hypothetical protein